MSIASRAADLPIGLKIAAAPAIALAAAAGIAAVAYFGANSSEQRLGSITDTILPRTARSEVLGDTFAAIQENVFRAMSWQSAGMPDAKIAGLHKEVKAKFTSVQTMAKEIRASLPQGHSATETLAGLDKDFTAYAKAVDDTFDLLSDPALSAQYVGAADAAYLKLSKKIHDFIDAEDAAMRAMMAEARAADQTTIWWLVVTLAGAFAIVILSTLGLTLAVTGSIKRAIAAMTSLARGDLSTAIPGLGRRDEIGAMASALGVFKDNALATQKLRAEQEADKARAEADKRAAMLALAGQFEDSVGGIVRAVASAATELHATAGTLAASAEQTTRQAASVGQTSESASANVATVAAAAEEMTSSVREIARQMAEQTGISAKASREAESTAATVRALSEAAQKIGGIVELISNIAGQTNLLALNATIEAARAGEAGRGFAVVASEVKNLAEQTSKATQEIAAQISAIQASTASSADAIGAITTVIGQINAIASSIAAAVEEQGASSGEIARNAQQAARGTDAVVATMGEVRRAAGEASAASTQVLASASDLSRQSEQLRGEVDSFLARVRAA